MALAKLPECFGEIEMKKGYFPHRFNVQGNQDYVGPLSDVSYCSPEMMASAASIFLEWYEVHKNDIFEIKKEILKYCR